MPPRHVDANVVNELERTVIDSAIAAKCPRATISGYLFIEAALRNINQVTLRDLEARNRCY